MAHGVDIWSFVQLVH